MAGYSTTPLIRKPGLTPEMKVLLIDPPINYYELLEMDLSKQKVVNSEKPDFGYAFINSKSILENALTDIVSDIKPTTIIWISWYKKSAKSSTEITEDVIREIALKSIFVDVKVCAVTDVWSGLKLVVRKEKRNF